MLAHHVAAYYSLGHFVEPQSKSLVVQKNPGTRLPALRLLDLIEPAEQALLFYSEPNPSSASQIGNIHQQQLQQPGEGDHNDHAATINAPSSTSGSSVVGEYKIMRRESPAIITTPNTINAEAPSHSAAVKSTSGGGSASNTGVVGKSLDQREAEYEAARERIFASQDEATDESIITKDGIQENNQEEEEVEISLEQHQQQQQRQQQPASSNQVDLDDKSGLSPDAPPFIPSSSSHGMPLSSAHASQPYYHQQHSHHQGYSHQQGYFSHRPSYNQQQYQQQQGQKTPGTKVISIIDPSQARPPEHILTIENISCKAINAGKETPQDKLSILSNLYPNTVFRPRLNTNECGYVIFHTAADAKAALESQSDKSNNHQDQCEDAKNAVLRRELGLAMWRPRITDAH